MRYPRQDEIDEAVVLCEHVWKTVRQIKPGGASFYIAESIDTTMELVKLIQQRRIEDALTDLREAIERLDK